MPTLLLAAVLGALPAAAQQNQATVGDLRIVQEATKIEAFRGEKPVFTYQFAADLPKPFVHPLLSPAGHEITLASPPDHVHHRGLMFALGSVTFAGEADHVVFWGEEGAPNQLGRIVPVPGSEVIFGEALNPAAVALEQRCEWRRLSDQALMLKENRRIVLHDTGDLGCYLLTWTSELTAPDRDIVLGPTPGRDVSYYGLGLRVPHDMDGGQVLDANGKVGEQAVNGDDARWCAYAGPKEPVRGFAMFDHPANPRHPTGWFVMSAGFGYMTASIVCHEPYTIPAGETLTLVYGVCVFDGSPKPEEVAEWYQRWLQMDR